MTTVKDTGPLDWRIAIVDKSGRPTQEFQRRWATQRANNALIGSVTFGTGTPPVTPTPNDGDEYIDTTKEPWVFYIGENSVWNIVGVQDFTDLDDVPGNYTSSADKLVRVNGNATGLEFITVSTGLDTLGNVTGDILVRGSSAWGVLAPGNASTVLTNDGNGTVSWGSASGGGVTSVGVVMPSIFSVSGSPITTSGNITVSLNTETAGTVLAGPTGGSVAVPSFRGIVSSDIPTLVLGFALGTGITGTNVSTPILVPRTGSITKCKFVTKTSDASTDLTFDIRRAGSSIFSTSPTVTHGTSSGTVSTFTSLTSVPLSVAIDDVLTLNISSGSATWQGTIQLE